MPKAGGGLIRVETGLMRERKASEPNHRHLSPLEFRTSQRKMEYICFVSPGHCQKRLGLCDSIISPISPHWPRGCTQKAKEGGCLSASYCQAGFREAGGGVSLGQSTICIRLDDDVQTSGNVFVLSK